MQLNCAPELKTMEWDCGTTFTVHGDLCLRETLATTVMITVYKLQIVIINDLPGTA